MRQMGRGCEYGFCCGWHLSGLPVWIGFSFFVPVIFLGLFSLFWIRDLLFGMRLKLLSDGVTLQWQERKTTGSVPIAAIRKILIGAQKPVSTGTHHSLSMTYVRIQRHDKTEQDLPPNIAQGLRARHWRNLKRLVAHVRAISSVTVELIQEPNIIADGWQDEPIAAALDTPLGR